MSTKPVAKKNRKTKSSKKYTPAPVKESDISSGQFYILKWIACITMTVDTVALFFQEQCHIPSTIFVAMRYVGRIAFPLFAYLMVESFRYTKNKKRHLIRIGILALVSELPFDVINISEKGIISFEHQNVCVTLFLAFLYLMIIDKYKDLFEKIYEKQDLKKLGQKVDVGFKITIAGVFAYLSYLIKADFAFSGIIFVALAYFSRGRKYKDLFLAFAFILLGLMRANLGYLVIIVPFVLILLFEHYHSKNKDKKIKKDPAVNRFVCSKFSKFFTKVFYPLHFIVLIVIRLVLSL